uniref:small VCP/p97-interacting protein isoform X1 n=1 Tax=Podarcis muralis TaxID=64176 RepID=UPI0010A0899F|nr:small VCP/p97-interacting protein isoform X1 [Podarcis muralis]
MGMCLPCMGGAADDVVETPDPELKRRQLAEAAEKRQMESASRGIKNPSSVEERKRKQEEMEKRLESGPGPGGGGLRVIMHKIKRCNFFFPTPLFKWQVG